MSLRGFMLHIRRQQGLEQCIVDGSTWRAHVVLKVNTPKIEAGFDHLHCLHLHPPPARLRGDASSHGH